MPLPPHTPINYSQEMFWPQVWDVTLSSQKTHLGRESSVSPQQPALWSWGNKVLGPGGRSGGYTTASTPGVDSRDCGGVNAVPFLNPK